MRKSHDLVAVTGTYTDRNGQEKKRYQKCGAAFTDDQGRISIKLEALPISTDWTGWIGLYEPRDEQQAPPAPPAADPLNEDVPF